MNGTSETVCSACIAQFGANSATTNNTRNRNFLPPAAFASKPSHAQAPPQERIRVRIEPRWRGFLYFVYEDEIVVVNPHDMHIVAVVAV
jgi:hypothetical protein